LRYLGAISVAVCVKVMIRLRWYA